MLFKSLTTRVIVIFIGLLTLGIGTFSFLSMKREQDQLIASARESTQLLLNTIERSIFNSMRIGSTDDVQITLEMLSQNRLLKGVRIFHPQGIILKSSDPREIGKPVNDEDYQLFINNKKERVFSLQGEGEVLAMIKPIYNEASCHFCHGTKTRLLGVLDVNYSLVDTEKKMVTATRIFVVSTLVMVVFLSLTMSMVMLKFVKVPLDNLMENMARVEDGDLSVRMKAEREDEIGRLMTSFNSMVERLDGAKRELEQYHFEQMERADRLASVGEMAAGIAHEIKNPLTGIAAAITIINEDFTEEDPRRGIMNEVLEQVKRLDKTVNDLLFFGKPTLPELAFSDVNAILQKTLWFASQHRGGKAIEHQLDLQEDLPPVYVDPKQIQQVFLNLILNAVQAMQQRDPAILTIRTRGFDRDAAPWVRVSIIDTGPGIPLQILGKIFTPFFTTKAQGTGLGLAICHKLISQQNGFIAVSSEDGKGTEFTIELPAARIPGAGEAPSEPVSIPGQEH